MNKLIELSPFIAALLIISVILGLFAFGAFDKPHETVITSAVLTEVIETAKLTSAKYIHNGIAKANVEGKGSGFVLYYAIVKPNVSLFEINYEINDDNKTVTVILPETFSFDVELLRDEEHKTRYYPQNINWTAKDIIHICEMDAKQEAENNKELLRRSQESIANTIEALLNPLLKENNYTLVFENNINQGGWNIE